VPEAVFLKASQIYDALPDDDYREWMAGEFAVEKVFAHHTGPQLSAEIKDKWRALFGR
jgi:hypothetical protein